MNAPLAKLMGGSAIQYMALPEVSISPSQQRQLLAARLAQAAHAQAQQTQRT